MSYRDAKGESEWNDYLLSEADKMLARNPWNEHDYRDLYLRARGLIDQLALSLNTLTGKKPNCMRTIDLRPDDGAKTDGGE